MRVGADRETCECYANCVAIAPDVFDLEDGFVAVLIRDPGPELHQATREAVDSCPVEALWIEDE
jgi:ferredoxin